MYVTVNIIENVIYTPVFYTENTGETDFPGGPRKVVPPLYITAWPCIKQHSDAGDVCYCEHTSQAPLMFHNITPNVLGRVARCPSHH